MTALNVTLIWIELAVWAAMVSTAQFSLSRLRFILSLGTSLDMSQNSKDDLGQVLEQVLGHILRQQNVY